MSIAKVLLLAALLGAPIKQYDKQPAYDIALTGYVSAYAEQPTIHTAQYRYSVGDIPERKGYYVATIGCDYVGWRGILHSDQGESIPVTVFDCAGADGAFDWFEANNIVAEVGYYLWQDYPEIVGSFAELQIRKVKN